MNLLLTSITASWFKLGTEIIILAITAVVAAITYALRKKIGEWIVKGLESAFSLKIYSFGHYKKGEVERDIKLQDILAALRNQVKADRTAIFQFHNGSLFQCKNQMWKVSQTHESLSTGIKPCIGDVQGILSSCVSTLIYPLWENDLSNFSGIEKISPEHCGCPNKNKCKLPNGVYFIETAKLEDGFVKGLLISEAIKYKVISPLLDSFGNRVGFLAVSYCWDDANVEQIKSYAEVICQTAVFISFELRKTV